MFLNPKDALNAGKDSGGGLSKELLHAKAQIEVTVRREGDRKIYSAIEFIDFWADHADANARARGSESIKLEKI